MQLPVQAVSISIKQILVAEAPCMELSYLEALFSADKFSPLIFAAALHFKLLFNITHVCVYFNVWSIISTL